MVVSLDHYNRGSTPSPSSPGALGLRPSCPDSMLVPTCGPTTPKETRQPLQTLHASNKTPLTAVKGCCEDEEHEPASAGLSPSSLAQRLFNDGFDVFCDDMGLLNDNKAQEGAISPGDSAFQETVAQDMIAATSAQGQQSLWGGAAPSPAFPGFSGTSPDDRAGPLAVSAATNASVGQLVASQEGKKERAGAAARPGAPVGAKSALPVAGAATGTRSKRVAWRDPLSVPDAGGEGAADAGRLGTVGTTPSGAAAEEAAASPAATKRKRHLIQTEFTHEEALVAFADDSKWDEVGAGLLHARGCKNCGAKKTTQWRSGPGGPKTLCNACGVRWSVDNKTAQAAAAAWPLLPQR